MLPDVIITRIHEFLADGKTGQISLNIFEGEVMNAEVKERILAQPQKKLDKRKRIASVGSHT